MQTHLFLRWSISAKENAELDEDAALDEADQELIEKMLQSGSFARPSGSFRQSLRRSRPTTPEPVFRSMRIPSPHLRSSGRGRGPLEGAQSGGGLRDVFEMDSEDDSEVEVSSEINWMKLLVLNKPEASFIACGCVAALITGTEI